MKQKGSQSKRFLWQPILLLTIIVIGLTIYILNATANSEQLQVQSNRDPISKVEMKVVSASGVNRLTLTNPQQLDSIQTALQEAKEVIVSLGGGFEIWSDVTIYKNEKSLGFRVLNSKYHGWYMEIGGKTFSSAYIFDLVKRNAKI